MSLFNQVLGALNNPEQEANNNQLSGIIEAVSQLSSNNNTNTSAVQSAMSIVGSFTRSALQEQRNTGGDQQVQDIISQFGGNQASPQAVQMLFGTSQIQQMTQEIASRTGIDAGAVQGMLPTLVPLVLNFLKTGNSSGGGLGSNPVAGAFLDADNDGDVDIADALKMASQHLGR